MGNLIKICRNRYIKLFCEMRMNQSINNHHHHNPMEQLLTEMRLHVSNLQDKLQVANSAVNKGQNVIGKIEQMKEYQEKVASLNSCWRTKNRAQLVSNLQQENRQIMALEEENRQLHMALKEMKDGMELIMSDFRRVASDFMRAEVLSDIAESQQKNTFMMGVSHEKYIGLARASETYMQFSDQKATEDQALIAQLCLENKTLRSLLQGVPIPELTNLTADKSNKTTDLSTKSSPSETSSHIKI